MITVAGDYTISATGDVVAKNMAVQGRNKTVATHTTLDMDGHAFTLSNTNNNMCIISGTAANTPSFDQQWGHLTLVNGTFNIARITLAYTGTQEAGGLTVGAGATWNGYVSYWNNGSRVTVKDGARWNVGPAWYGVNFAGQNASMNGSYGYLCVTGAQSRVVLDKGNMDIRGQHMGVYVLDGGAITGVRELYVGGDGKVSRVSDDTFLEIRNGTLSATTKIVVGTPLNDRCSPRVTVGGADSYLLVNDSAYTNTIYNGHGAKLEFDLSGGAFTNAAGELRAPIRLKNLAFVERDPTFTDYGDTTVAVTGLDWMLAHGGEEIPLIELTVNTCSAALETLAQGGVFPEINPTRFRTQPQLFVKDGRKLMFRVPKRNVGTTLVIR